MALWIMFRAMIGAVLASAFRFERLRRTWSFRYEVMARVLKRAFSVIWRQSYPTQRRLMAKMSLPHPILKQVRFNAAELPGEWCEPLASAAHSGIYLYLHGGGFTVGSVSTHRELIARQTLAIGGRTLALNYRLAPEHPYPAALDDALFAYQWLRSQGHTQIIVGGDSAGGNLAVALMLRLRERGLPLPTAGVLLCPWVDVSARGGTLVSNAAFDWAEPQQFIDWQQAYVPPSVSAKDPLVSPLHADLSGLPPLLVHGGTAEMLLDQERAFVAAARKAGVDVTAHEYEDMVHNWHVFGAMFPESLAAIADIGAFVRPLFASK